MKVVIDDVEYVPAVEAIANADAIRRALVAVFYGECSDDAEFKEMCRTLRVEVTDDVDERAEYTTINDIVADIAKRAARALADSISREG